ncbi:hypothetical protein SDC9_136946 [bioreactor metagenome]|uniref:Uncharacterized protein n=1 Tax=bioreactor metagenome TaxID=1076179 RepID=A0A645DKQ4_9ZZZZ
MGNTAGTATGAALVHQGHVGRQRHIKHVLIVTDIDRTTGTVGKAEGHLMVLTHFCSL